MTAAFVGRRRGGGAAGGYTATITAANLASHGGGYPLTYAFTVPEGTTGTTAQWRRTATAPWSTIPAAPSVRFDGLDNVARVDGTTVYISKAFPVSHPEIHLRVIDGDGTEVGTFVEVSQNYDARTIAVVFTYDDNPSLPLWTASTATHQAAGLWMSPGLNGAGFGDEFSSTKISPTTITAAVNAGYVEPANHGLTHANPMDFPEGQEQALSDADVIGGRDAILAATPMPSPSRGMVHGYIYPYGWHDSYIYTACATAGHLVGRLVLPITTTVEAGNYTPGTWDETYGMITQLRASVAPIEGTRGDIPIVGAEAEAAAQKVIDSVNYAKTAGSQCVVYGYVRHWNWGTSDPWPQMLAAVGAMTDIWSVGHGHLALYQRTRQQVTVTDAAP